MYILSDTSRSTIILFLIALLLIFIFMTLFYVLFMQKKQNDFLRQSLKDNNEQNLKTNEEIKNDENINEEIKSQVDEDNFKIELPAYKEKEEAPLNETMELKNITESLEALPQEKKIDMTPYEEEQEEKAIISYDELISKSNYASINYSDTNVYDDVVVKKVDLDKTGQIELDPIKRQMNSKVELRDYRHEEEFLEALKKLEKLLM